jgi:multicomponent Na+:H+ antiporter subunit F
LKRPALILKTGLREKSGRRLVSLSETILDYATTLALAILCVSFALTVWRVIKGPTLPDRILALDMLVAVAIGFIAVISIKTGFRLYVDIALALGLVGFLATVAFARFVLQSSVAKNTSGKRKGGKNVG